MAEKVGGIYYEVDLDTRKMVDGQRRASRELDGLATKLTATAAAVAVMAAALATLKIAKLADEILLLSTRVEVAAGNIESGAAAMSSLVDISRRTQSSLAGNIEVFTRLNQSILQMGGTQQDTLRLTELLAKAIKVSGASAVEAKSAMLQFGQALGSGKLAGDELRSLLETAPYLMQQLAAGIGVPVGALKKLGEEGKLTADVVTAALGKAAAKIDEDFRKFPQTIESAMVVAQDQAALAALKFDQLTGGSAALTGVVKGLGEVFTKLGEQFGAANTEAGNLGRNQAVSSWADKTRVALSYVIDAADLTWQTLQVLGRNTYFVLERIAAAGRAQIEGWKLLAKGDVAGYLQAYSNLRAEDARRRKEVDAADAETLRDRKLAGQQMRDAWEQGAGGGRGFVNPTPAPNKLRGGGGGSDKGAKFDAEAYLGGLEAKTLEGLARIDAMEKEALRKNAELLKAGKITRAEAAKAANLIETQAAQDRLDIQLKNAEDIRSAMEDGAKKEAELLARQAEERAKGQSFAQGVIGSADPIAQLEFELQAKSALLAQYAAIDQENAILYAQARVALEQETAAKMREVLQKQRDDQNAQNSAMLQNYAGLFGNLAELTRAFGGKQSGAYRALFAVSKGFAIADSIIKIQQGIAAAAALPFPTNIPAMATVAAQTAGIISTIQGTNFGGGRQYGGPTTAGSLYRINEGGRPEMFTAANGAQYMLPTTNGRVTSADQVGGGGKVEWKVIVNGAPPGTTASVNDQEKTVTVVVAEVAQQIATNRGPVWTALRGATNVQGRIA